MHHTTVLCPRCQHRLLTPSALLPLPPCSMYGGIHIPADNEDGLKIGTQVGAMAYLKAARYWGGGASFTSSAAPGANA